VTAGYREILFRDETFSAFRERNREICRGILRRGIQVGWICNVKPGTVTAQDLALFKQAGCRLVKVGIESGSDRVLRQSGKGISTRTTRRLMSDIHRVGLDVHAHVMLGMPGETLDSVRETIDFILEIEPTTLDVGICTPLPGTRLWQQLCAQADRLEGQDLEKAHLHVRSVFSHCYCDVPGPELEKNVRRLYRRFYLRPKYVWKRASEVDNIRVGCDLVRSGLSVVRFVL
jgi:radical SAM superfamily enzyme YgiQ (UPF0313 family)